MTTSQISSEQFRRFDASDDLFTVYAENGEPIAYAARLSEYMETIGTRYWYAGSASGPVVGYVERLKVGASFRHWNFGEVSVTKINRKTIRLSTPEGVERIMEV